MSAYFAGGNSEIQAADRTQTLIFMNPSYVNNQHHQNPNNFVFANPSMSPATNLTEQLVGIPLQQNNHHFEAISAFQSLIPRPHYNLWTPIDPSTAVRETLRAQQGLSLSLSDSQQQVGLSGTPSSAISPPPGSKDNEMVSGGTQSPASIISNGPVSGMRSVLLSSKYLKATQQLLEEVVNVGSATDSAKKKDTATSSSCKAAIESSSPEAAAAPAAAGDGENGGKKAEELSTAERHEIQMKKGKLVCMLDEVEQRYRQYHQQMQMVIASFEQAAGQGSARTYTALALRTISRQFRCLKDAIVVQIRAVNKSLGEEEEEDMVGKEGGSRLKFVDHHLRQQRALQQLGMIQHNAWRPQRGLPERSVSVLRAWLFEHFLHPYPKDSDKHMLAKQTRLTRSQVSNWFINARVRLWKPMVEEMYNEELKELENHGSADKTGISGNNNGDASASKVPTDENQNVSFKNASQENTGGTYQNAAAKSDSVSPGRLRNQTTGFSLVGSSELEGITKISPKQQRSNDLMMHSTVSFPSNMEMKSSNEHVLMQFGIERQTRDDYASMAAGPFVSYPMEEISRFDTNHQYQPRFSGNGVSLTLGLTDTPQSFFPNQNIRRMDMGEAPELGTMNNNPNPGHTNSTAYESINIENSKRFTVQLLPDFVV